MCLSNVITALRSACIPLSKWRLSLVEDFVPSLEPDDVLRCFSPEFLRLGDTSPVDRFIQTPIGSWISHTLVTVIICTATAATAPRIYVKQVKKKKKNKGKRTRTRKALIVFTTLQLNCSHTRQTTDQSTVLKRAV